MKRFIPLVCAALLPFSLFSQEVNPATPPQNAMAEPTAKPLKEFPRYASVKKGEVNVRSGPGNQYPILWVYQRAGYPVRLLTRYDNYFKVRDVEGEEGWVYIGMVSARKTALVRTDNPVPLYRRDNPESDVVAKLGKNVVVELDDDGCTGPLCRIDVEGLRGWVAKTALTMLD
jgi:SH3-like domain-containing protein